MSVTTLRERVMGWAGKPTTPALLCITGASGAGKTAAVAAIRERIERRVLPTLELDSLGVPSVDEMHAAWESPRGWQKAMTWHFVYTAKHVYRTHPLVVLEGQFDPQYAIAACSAHRVRSIVLLLHADDAVRRERLVQRGSVCNAATLATPATPTTPATPETPETPETLESLESLESLEWASYLRESAQQLGGVVIDSCAALDAVVDTICAHAVTLLDSVADDARAPRELRDPRDRAARKRIN